MISLSIALLFLILPLGFATIPWGLKVFPFLVSGIFYGGTYVLKEEAVTKMRSYLIYVNGDLYMEKKMKWSIHDDGNKMELEFEAPAKRRFSEDEDFEDREMLSLEKEEVEEP
jgi:hypothetical protein